MRDPIIKKWEKSKKEYRVRKIEYDDKIGYIVYYYNISRKIRENRIFHHYINKKRVHIN